MCWGESWVEFPLLQVDFSWLLQITANTTMPASGLISCPCQTVKLLKEGALHHIRWPASVNHLYILAFARLWCSFWDHHRGSNHCQILSLSWQMSLLLASLAFLPWIADSYSQLLGPICYWSWTSMLTCTWIVSKKQANTFSKRKLIFLI